MSWGRIDDRLDDSPKFAGIDPAAAGLWLLCQPQALRRGDGFVPEGVPTRFAQGRGSHAPSLLIAILVARGLWDEVDGGWVYHDFDSYSKLHNKRSEAGSKGAATRWQTDGKPMAKDASRDGKELTRTRSRTQVAKATTPKPPKGAVPAEILTFTEVWNASCGVCPTLRKPPQGVVKQRPVLDTMAYVDGDVVVLAAAIRRYQADEFIASKGYGFETFCRHPERWVVAARPVVVDFDVDRESEVAAEIRRRERAAFVPDPDVPSTPAAISAMMRRTAEAMAVHG